MVVYSKCTKTYVRQAKQFCHSSPSSKPCCTDAIIKARFIEEKWQFVTSLDDRQFQTPRRCGFSGGCAPTLRRLRLSVPVAYFQLMIPTFSISFLSLLAWSSSCIRGSSEVCNHFLSHSPLMLLTLWLLFGRVSLRRAGRASSAIRRVVPSPFRTTLTSPPQRSFACRSKHDAR